MTQDIFDKVINFILGDEKRSGGDRRIAKPRKRKNEKRTSQRRKDGKR